MEHNHSHTHDHGHHHNIVLTSVNKAFVIGIILNFLFVTVEVIAGLYIHSLSLLSDAGHNLADVASLALSLLAFRLMKVKSTDRFTYGYRKTSILVALFNAAVLFISVGAISYEAIHRFLDPQPLPGKTIALVAGVGIIINFTTAILFMKDRDKDLNIRGAYLHLMADALVSAGLVVGGIIMYFTHQYWLDPVLSLIIAIVIIFGTWKLLKDSLRLSLDGVPAGIDIEKIKENALKIAGVKGIHHIHVWGISTTENAMTAHLILEFGSSPKDEQRIKHNFRHSMEHLVIHHVTIETERENEHCNDVQC